MTDAVEPPSLPVIDAVTDYEKIERIGEGTFGIVCAWRHAHACQHTTQLPQTRRGNAALGKLWH